MTDERIYHVRAEAGTLHLPCGTCIDWVTHKYSGRGSKTSYTTEIDISHESDRDGRIDATEAEFINGVCIAHTTVYDVEHKEPDKIWPLPKEVTK